MGDPFRSLQLVMVNQRLSAAQFDRLQRVLEEIAQAPAAHLLTETSELSSVPVAAISQTPQRFSLLLTPNFNVLLEGILLPERSSELSVWAYEVRLSFELETIAAFIQQWCDRLPPSPLRTQLQQHLATLQPTAVSHQSELILKLIAAVATDPVAELEHERLLHQVMVQIRQSLELPVILQAAVDQMRTLLKSDRLVIYQLDPDPAVTEALTASGHQGVVTYEARRSNDIPSVLHLTDRCHFAPTQPHMEQYRQGLAVAIDNIELTYPQKPCLIQFLKAAYVCSKLLAPIWVQGQLWGFLIAHACHQPRHWQESEQRFLQQIAEHLAIAIHQAQLYTELQQQKQTLEQRVAERTQALQDVMLAAQAANRAKSEFLATVSHELRTPLTCIIGMSKTLQRWSADALTERQQNFLQTIHDSGEQLLTLINDILDLSQAEAGKVVLNVIDFSLTELTQETIQAFAGQATLQDIKLMLDLRVDAESDRFTADPRRVQQILFNLLSNAIKFTPAEGTVTLRVRHEENQALFQVEDTGIGIPAEQMPLLFQKFQQLDQGYQRQYGGTGLGLALTKQLVELQGGWITVDSTVEVGSTFTVRLPIQPLVAGATTKTRNADSLNQPRGRIVLIEPQEENANLICDVLTAAGYQLVWMLEGSTAVDQIEILHPIAVITNVQLPDIDGHYLIRCLRQNSATQSFKVIALTHPSAQSSSTWQEAGADDYLRQPIRPDQLLQKLMALTT
jgi:two-component system sensor histidine kinase/response regulator